MQEFFFQYDKIKHPPPFINTTPPKDCYKNTDKTLFEENDVDKDQVQVELVISKRCDITDRDMNGIIRKPDDKMKGLLSEDFGLKPQKILLKWQ